MAIKAGNHVVVFSSGVKGVCTGVDGEVATLRLRGEDGSFATVETLMPLSELRGTKGRPCHLAKLPPLATTSEDDSPSVVVDTTPEA